MRVALAALVGAASLGAFAGDLARGDAAWSGRAEGEEDGRPRPEPIFDAVEAYGRALAAEPDSLEVRWKLLRALHFAGDFAARDEREAAGLFDRARAVSEQGLELLARWVGSDERLEALSPEAAARRLEASGVPQQDVARLYFWSAINWGAWSRSVGLLSAVRQGVANRLFQYTSVTLALEPGYEDGGALRLLGRLHAELPRVPFVSGWVDREQALPLMERAYALAPAHPGNRLLLALTLLDLVPERRPEALALLQQVAGLEPQRGARIEELAIREEARARLGAERGDGAT